MKHRRLSMAASLAGLAGLAMSGGCASEPREGVDQVFNFWPLATYETSEQPPGHQVDVLWPLIQDRTSGDEHDQHVVPLYWSESEPDGEWLNVLLLYNQKRKPGDFDRMLFPVYWQGSNALNDQWYLHVWPLYGLETWQGEHPGRKDFFVWPLLTWRRADDGTSSEVGLLDCDEPLQLVHWSRMQWEGETASDGLPSIVKNLAVLRVLFDLFHLVEYRAGPPIADVTPRSHDVSVLGLFDEEFAVYADRESVGRSRKTQVLGLEEPGWALYSRVRRDAKDDAPASTASHVFPIWFQSDVEGVSSWTAVLPLYSSSEEENGTRRSLWIVPPIVHHEVDESKSLRALDVMWPIYRHESVVIDGKPLVNWRLLPLFWFKSDGTLQQQFAVPFYWRVRSPESDWLFVFPFWGQQTTAGGLRNTTFVLPPLWFATHDERNHLHEYDVLWPLSEFSSSNEGTVSRVFPLFFSSVTPYRSHLNVLGFLDRDEAEVSQHMLVWPLYASAKSQGEGESHGLLPLMDLRVLDDDGPRGDEFSVLWPLSQFHSDGRDGGAIERWVFPFYWWFDDGADQSFKMIWPFFGVHRAGEHRTWSVLFPFFFHGSDEKGWSETGILFPFAASNSDGNVPHGKATRWLFPLWWWQDTLVDGTPSASEGWVLWPFFRYDREADDSMHWDSFFFLADYASSTALDSESLEILGALYRSHRDGAHVQRSIPFLFGFERDDAGATLKLFHLIPIRW